MTGKPEDIGEDEAAARLRAAFAADRMDWQQQLRGDLLRALVALSHRNHPPKEADILAQILNVFSDLTANADLRELVADFVERLPYEMNRRRRHNMKVWEQLQRNEARLRRDAEKPPPEK
ncbi:hypothetical protein [Paracoccus sp. N5]|uniref:hypothetical protein n=1 Tax=Paracoccus sp. N5 TaxID=1101189 RepID=UPI00039CCCBC|nr:hypothetical protein [Paracoccus sp. N5]